MIIQILGGDGQYLIIGKGFLLDGFHTWGCTGFDGGSIGEGSEPGCLRPLNAKPNLFAKPNYLLAA